MSIVCLPRVRGAPRYLKIGDRRRLNVAARKRLILSGLILSPRDHVWRGRAGQPAGWLASRKICFGIYFEVAQSTAIISDEKVTTVSQTSKPGRQHPSS